jgi:hypothetical protein
VQRQIQQRKKDYVFTSIGVSPSFSVSKYMLQNWGLQVEVGAGVTDWTVDLEVTIGGATFKKIIRHNLASGNGEINWLQTPRPVDQIRFNLTSMTGSGECPLLLDWTNMKSIFFVLFILITLIVSKAFSAGDPIDVNCVSGCSGGSGGIAGTVGIGGQPIEVKGTVSVDGITFPGTLSVQVLNPQGTIVVSNPQTSVSITGVVNTNGTQVISGPVNTVGTITVGGGTVSIAGVVPTTGTLQIATGSNVIGSISNTSFGISGIVNTTGTQSISGVVTTVGTQSIAGSVNVNGTMALSANAATASNQSSVISQLGTLNSQLSSGTTSVAVTNNISGFATSAKQDLLQSTSGSISGSVTSIDTKLSSQSTAAKQDTMISNLGTIGNAVVNGTLNVLAKSEILYGSLAVTAGAMGTLEMDTSNGYSAFRIFNDQSGSDVGTDINWYGTKSGSGPWEPLSCFNVDALDGQFLFGSGYWLGAGFPIDDFVCDISTFQRVRVVAQAGVSGLSLIVGAGKQANTIFGIGSTLFQVDYQWRTVGGDGVTPGPDGNAPTAANSKPVIPATDSQPFPVKGTIACSNCTGSSSSGTTAVSGTVSVAVVGVVNTNGTIVQGTGGSSAWLTTSTGGTLTKITTIDTITNAITVNSHAVTGTVGLTGGTIGISGPVNTFGTMNITGGTIGVSGVVTTAGTVSITGGTVGVAGVVTTAGTVSITGGTVGIAGVVTTAGTLVQGTGGTSAWLTTSTGGTLNLISAVTAITNALPTGTNNLGFINVQTGTLALVSQVGTIALANSIAGQSGVAGGGGTLTANVQRIVPSLSSTYMAATQAWTPGATPTALLKFQGSQTTTAKLKYLDLSCTQTTAGINNFYLLKRSTATIGGTFATSTAVPLDSASPSATAVFGWYTANNNGTLGALVGTMGIASLLCPAPGGTANDRYRFDFTNSVMEPAVVRGTTQMYELNFNGAALPAGLSIKAQAVWTEE